MGILIVKSSKHTKASLRNHTCALKRGLMRSMTSSRERTDLDGFSCTTALSLSLFRGHDAVNCSHASIV